jgi:hypothetical protein
MFLLKSTHFILKERTKIKLQRAFKQPERLQSLLGEPQLKKRLMRQVGDITTKDSFEIIP